MTPNSLEIRSTDARCTPRSSIYLAAALFCDGTSAPVKIRNISSIGALVEGSIIPPQGSLVQLVRGSLIVHGLVAWSGEGRCGIKFSGSVVVQRWRAVPTNAEQQRVDEVVRLVKAGAVPLPVPPLAVHGENNEENPAIEVSSDFQRVSELLESLGTTLSMDADVVERHGTALQNLDIAMQMLTALEAFITGRADLDSDSMKLSALRRSANQALRRSG